MSGERALLNTAIGRISAVLLTAAVALVSAIPATADPASDAGDAIGRAYDASGGATGPLGPSDGGVYPIGVGFGQNFAGGKIFFTPDTGAHIMGGAILEKYESLGGPADGDLGFPTIDEGPGRISPDSRNTTFSAADKPVIFWTPDTGAHVVRGAINAAWDKLGGSAGPLGVPTEDEVFTGDVVSQKFTAGQLSWNRSTKEFTTVPPELAAQLAGLAIPEDATSAINAARRAAGGALGPLGAKQGDQYTIGKDGAGQDFVGGKIFYSPATGANVVTGQVLKKYESVGGPEGDLGFPTSNEADGGLKTGSRVSTFSAKDQPVIFWTPDYGAFIVRGAMNAAWQKLGGPTGSLGPPVADQTENGNLVTQRFTGGEISWDKATDKFTTQPANLASSLSGLTIPGYEPPEATSAAAPSTEGRNWFTPSWWWLLAGVPLLVLVGLIVAATLRNRGGRDVEPDDVLFDDADAGDDLRLLDGDDEAVAARLADRYGRPSGTDTYGLGGSDRDLFAPRAVDEDAASAIDPEPDETDTAPTRILAEEDTNSGRHAAIHVDELPVGVDEDLGLDVGEDREPEEEPEEEPEAESAPNSAQPSIHLPLSDPYLAPGGYPIKADTHSGLYWTPDSDLYDDVPAEVYFVNEEFARANGFVKAD